MNWIQRIAKIRYMEWDSYNREKHYFDNRTWKKPTLAEAESLDAPSELQR